MPDQNHLIFVNYRGSDEMWATEYVYARIAEAFGAEVVFKAGNALAPGDDYTAILEEKAALCPVMLVCIGRNWLAPKTTDGIPRLHDPEDWVRREIAISLRADRLVVPILFGNHGAVSVPKESELPDDIRALTRRQARRFAPGGGLDLTVPKLIDELAAEIPALGERLAARRSGQQPSRRSAEAPNGPTRRDTEGAAFHIGHIGTVQGDVVGRDKIVYRGPGTPRT